MNNKFKISELIEYLDKLQYIIEDEYRGTTEWEVNHKEYQLKYEEIKNILLDLEK